MSNSIENYSGNIKCKISTAESAVYDLCITCNIEQQYFPALFPETDFLHGFTECFNSITKPVNFYFDNSHNEYKPCYETCLTCNEGGNGENNNCLTCEINYIKKPEFPESNNCVTECFYSYYYTSFGQYKCTNSSSCPEEANLYIKEMKKCTSDCQNEVKYKFQYGGQCVESCPNDTLPNEKNICKDINNDNNCVKSENKIDLQEFLTHGGVDLNAKNYAKEFEYTTKHVSKFYNDLYSILIYKDINCLEELSINIPKVEFGNCYTIVQNKLQPPSDDKLVVALVERLGTKKSTTSYSFYHPQTGEKLDAENICKEEQIIVKESVISQLNNSDVDINTALYLTQQNIDIFNLSDAFYNDICYHFESPNGKDVPLQDRIKSYYPNITLCDSGCTSKGVNLTSMESICECKFNDILNNELIEGNALIQSALGEVSDLLSSSNLLVLKCYENVFIKDNILKGTGGFIIMVIALFEIIFALLFIFYDMNIIMKYLYNLTEYFMLYISNINLFKNNILITLSSKVSAPSKKGKANTSKSIKININRNKKYNNENSIKVKYEDVNLSKSANTNKSETRLINKSNKINNNSKKNKKYNEKKLMDFFRKNKPDDLSKLLRAKTNCGNINMEEYLKQDLDDMEYDDAKKLDKRTFCEFFIERLKEKQIIMDTFYHKENLRPLSIKIILLLLNIDLYFVINGIFFNEEYISELFNSDEEETFFSFIPRSIKRFFYATMVSFIIGIIIDCIFIEEKKIRRIFLREKDDLFQIKYEIFLNVKSIKKRYYVFIFLCIFLSIFSWYYISCFNNTYPNVKTEWIKSSITIIIIMQILSILNVLLQAILRALSFHYKSEKLYKAKQFLS